MMNSINEVINYYEKKDVVFALDQFLQQVELFFKMNPVLNDNLIVHSIKSRRKDPEHLRDKLNRKQERGQSVTKETLFQSVTDLIGMRILHLYQQQFSLIHSEIMKKIEIDEDWKLVESPKAYTWEPESENFFKDLGIETEIRDTYYTSVHYVVKPNNDKTNVSCEIQVRTLFEEIWGEIDHTINYPHQTDSLACKEQIRVLAKLVSTGTRLADSIFRTYDEHLNTKS
jgi:ppGpp synthetase/RelA/SpoT-type nucleotidyltranferase